MLDNNDRDEIARIMRVIVESDITPKLNLILEGHQDILGKLIPESRVVKLEEDVTILKIAVRQLSEDMQLLKKAQ